MVFKRLQVIQSYDEPYDKNVLWLKNKTLRQYVNGEWVEIISQYTQNFPDTAMSDISTNTVQNNTIKAYVDKLKVIEVFQSKITQIKLKPNILYKLSEITNLDITFDTKQTDMANYYMFELEVGDTIPTITYPEGIKWMNGYNILENLTTNTTYQISILNNLAVGGAF